MKNDKGQARLVRYPVDVKMRLPSGIGADVVVRTDHWDALSVVAILELKVPDQVRARALADALEGAARDLRGFKGR